MRARNAALGIAGIEAPTGNPYNMNLTFEWDEAKARTNLRRHGISFDRAMRVFYDGFAIESIDDRTGYGEERVNLIGMSEVGLLHVTYTERGDRIRVISARPATRNEKQNYYRENSP